MSIEKAKTTILIFLVGLSVILTGMLWYGFRPLPAVTLGQVEEQVQLGAEKETVDLLTPIWATVSLGEGRYARLEPASSFFREGWEQVIARLGQEDLWLLEQGWETVPIPPDLEEPGTWQWDFPLALDLNHWRDLLQQEGGGGMAPKMAKLVLAPGGDSYICDPEGNYYPWSLDLSLPLPEAENLIQYERPQIEGYVFAPGVYTPLEEPMFPVMRATVEKLPAESVAGTFFADMSLVRRIRERDEAVIYTDGQRALRLYPSGALEYNYPGLQEKSPTLPFPAAWERSRLFVEQHGGWPPEIRIGGIKKEIWNNGEQYHFSYRQYQNGLPIHLPEPAFSLYLHSGGVLVYERLVVTPYLADPPRPVVDPAALLEGLPELPSPEEDGSEGEGVVITGLSLLYLGRPVGEREYILEPAWSLEIGEEQYYFDAHTGKVLRPPGTGEGKEETVWTGAGPRIS